MSGPLATAGGPGAAAPDAGEAIRAAAARIAAAGSSRLRPARDPVNLPMIRNWAEAIGDASPVYADAGAAARSVHGGLVAPPAMAQVWTMGGLHPVRDGADDDPLHLMSAVLDEAGFTSVVATNCEQEYHRYLRHGEHVAVSATLESVTGPKRTALGEGWFVTTRSTWYVGTEAVATMLFRLLKYRPPDAAAAASGPAAGDVLRPAVSPDTRFFWAGTAAGELRIQRCGECGALRHPPGPMCPACGAARPDYVVAAGTGEVYSYVVHHHPPVPGRDLPIVIALVALPEGVRMVGELLGVSPERAAVGLPVTVSFVRVDDDLTLPAWREDPR
ncbi:MAG TPA: bifunctional MaoC family dehydratase N-terminal/OB-fold nucleic acid binding domain-containing protein [Streptosporangiaceae bacterium]